jgi:hypothetical protein
MTKATEVGNLKHNKPEVTGPGKFKPSEWAACERQLVNALSLINGVSGVPLSCVIRKNRKAGQQGTLTHLRKRQCRVRLSGLIRQLCISTEGNT